MRRACEEVSGWQKAPELLLLTLCRRTTPGLPTGQCPSCHHTLPESVQPQMLGAARPHLEPHHTHILLAVLQDIELLAPIEQVKHLQAGHGRCAGLV